MHEIHEDPDNSVLPTQTISSIPVETASSTAGQMQPSSTLIRTAPLPTARSQNASDAPKPVGESSAGTPSPDYISYLKDEYLFLQKTYEDFDQRLLLIKGWSITASLAGIAAAFQYKVPAVWLISAGTAVLFWAIEAIWKSFQYAHSGRIREIEAFFRGDTPTDTQVANVLPPFQIYNSWYRTYSHPVPRPLSDLAEKKATITPLQQWIQIAKMPMIAMPHVLILATAILLFCCRHQVLPSQAQILEIAGPVIQQQTRKGSSAVVTHPAQSSPSPPTASKQPP